MGECVSESVHKWVCECVNESVSEWAIYYCVGD